MYFKGYQYNRNQNKNNKYLMLNNIIYLFYRIKKVNKKLKLIQIKKHNLKNFIIHKKNGYLKKQIK